MRTGKKILSAVMIFCLAALLSLPAFGAGFPVQKLDAPDKLQFLFSYPNEGSECIEAVYTVPDDLCAVASMSVEEQQKYYSGAFETCVQFDWSVDSKDDFHYDETWDTIQADCPIQKISGSFAERSEVFWFTYDEAVERCAPGIVTKSVPVPDEDSVVSVHTFDFDKHKLYVRARFFVYDYSAKAVHTSDWSEIADVGASREKDTPKVKGTMDAPVLSKARMDTQTQGVFYYDISFPDSVRETAYALKAVGTELNFESQIRIGGGEWQYWIVPDELFPYLVGTRQFSVLPDDLNSKIEYRCRLTGGNPDDGTAVTSAWSSIFTYENGEVQLLENDDPFDEKAQADAQKQAEKEANKCAVCGICPLHPLGVCMFIWIGILVAVALIVLYNVRASKKKKIRAAEIKAREEASRNADSDKTASIFNTDAIQPAPEKKEEDNHEL